MNMSNIFCGDRNGVLIFILLLLLFVFFLAYMPVKAKSEDEEKHNIDVVKKKLYSQLKSNFADTFSHSGHIVVYAGENGEDDEPKLTVISILLPDDILYLDFNYGYRCRKPLQYRNECFIKLSHDKQTAIINRDYQFDDIAAETIRLCAALNDLPDYKLQTYSEVE